MKKVFLCALLLVLGCVMTSQAVIVHWATDGVRSGTTSAQLVYVADGSAPFYTPASAPANFELVGNAVTGLAITPAGVGRQDTADAAARSSGAYYVVLFNDLNSYSYSLVSLTYNNTTAITYDEMAPAQGTFTPVADGQFSNWQTVPEPSTAMLLVAGAAVAALRRRKRA